MNSDIVDITTLQKIKTLSSLSEAQLKELSASMSVSSIGRRLKIFDQGESASQVYLLLSGAVRLVLENPEERKVLVALVPPGEFFGIGSLFPEKRHPFSAEAFSDCTIGLIEPETLIDNVVGVPFHAYLQSTNIFMGRIWRMFLHCFSKIGLSLRKRLALELLELAASFGTAGSRGTILDPSPTHSELANSIGASRQKVGECLLKFERRRIVSKEGRRLILNPRRLRQVVDRD